MHEPDYQAVTFVLFDANTISKDEEIGRMTLPIKDLPSGETKDLWLELGPAADDRLNNPLQMGFTVSLGSCVCILGVIIYCFISHWRCTASWNGFGGRLYSFDNHFNLVVEFVIFVPHLFS